MQLVLTYRNMEIVFSFFFLVPKELECVFVI